MMDVTPKSFTIPELVSALKSGQLTRNDEYQRGEAWTVVQKALFIDSILRRYPVPAIFLHKVTSPGLGGVNAERYDIVDGQQRLNALSDFAQGKFKLFELNDRSKLRIPRGVRDLPAPWAGRLYDELKDDLRTAFDGTRISVFVIEATTHPDEIRDLFIRLQSGTALSRQQIRDAWPGNIGPYVESIAGKLGRKPTHVLFEVIDRRGGRSDDEEQKDQYVGDRQTCAQLLRVFLARESDPNAYPSVTANEIDALYHEHTDFNSQSRTADRFKTCLAHAAEIFKRAQKYSEQGGAGKKKKYLRADVNAVMLFLQDVTKDERFLVNEEFLDTLAQRFAFLETDLPRPLGKSTSGPAMEKYYIEWRRVVGPEIGKRLDRRRLFSESQKLEISTRDRGQCGVCGQVVDESDVEYDHHPIEWRNGGPTEIENGRLVHKKCHPRGRPAA